MLVSAAVVFKRCSEAFSLDFKDEDRTSKQLLDRGSAFLQLQALVNR